MKKPIAYITAAWTSSEFEVSKTAAKYCRKLYEAGYTPVCPVLYLSLYLNDKVPQEHKDGIDMARDMLKRSRVLVVCGEKIDEAVKNDIAIAERLNITATTLEGILTVKGQGKENLHIGNRNYLINCV